MTETDMRPGSHYLSGAALAVPVWDPLLRLFHWGLVAAVAVAWLSAEESFPVHEVAGYTVAGLVAFRILWGLFGGRYARFTQFLKGPGATLGYLRDMISGKERRYLGHNPAGAAMIVALLVTLSGTAATGWLMEEQHEQTLLAGQTQMVAPMTADDDDDEYEGASGVSGEGREVSGPLKEVHEVFANLMLLLVALHVGGVVLASVRHRENLARAMVTGAKRAPGPDDVA